MYSPRLAGRYYWLNEMKGSLSACESQVSVNKYIPTRLTCGATSA